MKKNQHNIDTYLRYLGQVAELEALADMDGFGPNERAMFDAIVLAWSRQKPLTVTDASSIKELGSHATLHKRVLRLREMDLVKAVTDRFDHKTKYLAPTSKGLAYISQMGGALTLSLIL